MDSNTGPFAIAISTCLTAELPVHNYLGKLGHQVPTLITQQAVPPQQTENGNMKLQPQPQLHRTPTPTTTMPMITTPRTRTTPTPPTPTTTTVTTT